MPSWRGQSRGNVLGYKIFIFLLKKLGIGAAYLLLKLVAFYFFITSPKTSKIIYNYFHTRLKYNKLKSIISTYKNFNIFGQILIDKIAILSGLKEKYTFNFDGEEHLRNMVKDGTGGIIVNAHVGNFEIAGQLLERLNTRFNVLLVDAEHQKLKKYLSNVMTKKSIRFIPIKEDLSHILQLTEAFNNKKLIAMNGDRYVEGNSVVNVKFLGKEACFPTGPFLMASKFNVPVTFAFALKEKKYHYHFYATSPRYFKRYINKKKQEEEILKGINEYVQELEKMVKKYPLQWFNFYNFWEN